MAEAATKLAVKFDKKPTSVPAAPATWTPFETLRREIDKVFESMGGGMWPFTTGRSPLLSEAFWPRVAEWPVSPAMDVAVKEKEYEITAELPGLEEKDVEVKVANGVLVIKGEKKEEKEEREKDYYLTERRFGAFARSFAMPEGVDVGRIEATFAKGLLTVRMPKTVEAQKSETKIAVKAA